MLVKIFVAKKFNNFAFQCQLKIQDSTYTFGKWTAEPVKGWKSKI